MNQHQVTFSSTFEEADQQAINITSHLKSFYHNRLSNDIEFNINFVLREMFNNAVEHGNELQPEKKVVCRVVYDEDVLKIEVTDEGRGIQHETKTLTEPSGDANCIPTRRRGLWLIEQLGYKISCRNKTIIATYYWRVKK